jgi:hypothetical protein
VEANQVNVFTAPVFRNLEQVQDTEESGLARQLRSNIWKPDRFNRIYLDFSFLDAVSRTHPDMGARPDSDAASNFPATYCLAKSFGEGHEESFEADISEIMFLGSIGVNRSKSIAGRCGFQVVF